MINHKDMQEIEQNSVFILTNKDILTGKITEDVEYGDDSYDYDSQREPVTYSPQMDET